MQDGLGLPRITRATARAERILILACAAASAYMNVAAADVASPRSVAAYAIAPVALAVVVDRVVTVIRRHVLADREPSAWSIVGRAAWPRPGSPGWCCCTVCGSPWPRRRRLADYAGYAGRRSPACAS